jgi:hypothetical protein
MPREPEPSFPIGRVISFVIWVLVGIWGILRQERHGRTSPVAVYLAIGLFVLLGVILVISIVRRIFAKPRAGIIRRG